MIKTPIDWSDVQAAAKVAAGSWKEIRSFAWHRASKIDDPDAWLIYSTSHRDSEDLAKENEKVINERMRPFAVGADPDVVFEKHDHWAVGYLNGIGLRVVRPDGSATEAFKEFCRIMGNLKANLNLDEVPDMSQADVPISRTASLP